MNASVNPFLITCDFFDSASENDVNLPTIYLYMFPLSKTFSAPPIDFIFCFVSELISLQTPI